MNVLFIAFEFPPILTTGSIRPFKFAKYLKKYGITPIILCCDVNGAKRAFPNVKEDNNFLNELPQGTTIIRIPLKDISYLQNNLFHKIIYHYFTFEDGLGRNWKENVFNILPKVLKEYDPQLIYCTAPPFSIASLAKGISKKTQLPLVLDMRDHWLLWGTSAYISRIHYYFTWLKEKNAFKQASKIISVTKEVIDDFKQAHPEIAASKFHVIPNGFEDGEIDFTPIPLIPEQKIKIGYMGEFYYDPKAHDTIFKPWYKKKIHRMLQYYPRIEDYKYRSPYYFFKAIRALIDKYPQYKDRIEFHYIGNKYQWLTDMIKEFNLQANCVLYGKVNYSESIKIAKQNFNFSLSTSVKITNGKDYALASKTFDYLVLGKPILGFVTEGSQKTFLENCGIAYIFDPDQEEQNAEKLDQLFGSRSILNYNKEYINSFTREKNAQKLVEIFKGYEYPSI
jgi:Glycosyltransferase Family 4